MFFAIIGMTPSEYTRRHRLTLAAKELISSGSAEFNCTFKASAATNKRIYSEWFPSTGYERDNKPDIAAFFQMCHVLFTVFPVPPFQQFRLVIF